METPIAIQQSRSRRRCSRGTRDTGRTTPRWSSRRAHRTSTRSGSRGASSTPTSIAARMRLPSLGVARGDRVATVLANSLELLATYWACAKLGARRRAAVAAAHRDGLASLLADAPPRVVVAASDQTRDAGRRARQRLPRAPRMGADRRRRRRRGRAAIGRSARCIAAASDARRPRASRRATC